jgi:uncharacterized membrane protein HdeD (DUF308 family)
LQFDSKYAKKHEPIRATPRQRVGVVIVGVLLMLPGIAALFAGNLFYTDYRNLLVFAPFMLLIGVVMIIFALRVAKG